MTERTKMVIFQGGCDPVSYTHLFLTAAMRVYRVPEEEQAKVLAFIQ